MAIRNNPYSSTVDLGKILESGLSGLSNNLSSLSDRYAAMRENQKQREQQTKLKELEYYLSGQQAQQKREYETQQEQAKRQMEEQRTRSFYQGLLGGQPSNELIQPNGQQFTGGNQPFNQNIQQSFPGKRRIEELSDEDIYRAGIDARLTKDEIEKEIKENRARRQEIESSQKPQRETLQKFAEEIENEGRKSASNINNLETVFKLYEKQGSSNKLLAAADKFGLGDLLSGSKEEVAQKIFAHINNNLLNNTSRGGAELREQMSKATPSIFMSPEGIRTTSKMLILEQKEKQLLYKELLKIKEKAKNGVYPIDAIEQAYRNAEPKIAKLHEEQNQLMQNLIGKGSSEIQSKNEEENPNSPDNIVRSNEEESIPGQALRNLTSAGVRAGAGFAGVPSSLIEAAKGISSLGDKAGSALTEYLNPNLKKEYEQFTGQQYPTESPITKGLGAISEFVPGSERLKQEASKALPEGYTAPRNELEKAFYEAAEDMGSLLFPVGGALKGSKAVTHAAALAIPSNLAKLATKELGQDEKTQEAVKFGTMLMFGLGMQPSIRQKASDYYSEAKLNKPTQMVEFKNIRPKINAIREEYSHLGHTESADKTAMNKLLDSLEGKLGQNRAQVGEILEFKKDLNAEINELIKSNPSSRAIPQLIDIQETLNNGLKHNPNIPKSFSQPLITADNIWKETAAAEKALRFISSTTKKAMGLSSLGLVAHPILAGKALAASAATGAISSGAIKAGNTLRSIATNPVMAKEYAKMFSSAIKRSATGVLKSAHRIEKELEKEKEKRKKVSQAKVV